MKAFLTALVLAVCVPLTIGAADTPRSLYRTQPVQVAQVENPKNTGKARDTKINPDREAARVSAPVFSAATLEASAAIKINGPDSKPVGHAAFFVVEGLPDKTPFSMMMVPESGGNFYPLFDITYQPVGFFDSEKPGLYTCILTYYLDGKLGHAMKTCRIGGTVPIPVDPDPPIDPPIDPPNPPVPGPAGFRVLIMEETEDRHKPEVPLDVLLSTTMTRYLREKTIKVNGQPEYRLLDDDISSEFVGKMSKDWQAAYNRAKADYKGTLPWLLVTNGLAGESRPLPKTVEETMQILKKYGGN